MSDFSLVDAIECGIVKLPRVAVADNAVKAPAPIDRNLWDHTGKKMPRKGAGKTGDLDPLELPKELQTALHSLYSHHKIEHEEWERSAIGVPPVFIVVCNDTSSSKLVHEWIAGWQREHEGQMQAIQSGYLEGSGSSTASHFSQITSISTVLAMLFSGARRPRCPSPLGPLYVVVTCSLAGRPAMKHMQVRDAKAELSALIAAAERGEPTTITKHGKPAAVLVPVADARKLYPQSKPDFVEHLLAFPGGIEFERDETPVRDIDL